MVEISRSTNHLDYEKAIAEGYKQLALMNRKEIEEAGLGRLVSEDFEAT